MPQVLMFVNFVNACLMFVRLLQTLKPRYNEIFGRFCLMFVMFAGVWAYFLFFLQIVDMWITFSKTHIYIYKHTNIKYKYNINTFI